MAPTVIGAGRRRRQMRERCAPWPPPSSERRADEHAPAPRTSPASTTPTIAAPTLAPMMLARGGKGDGGGRERRARRRSARPDRCRGCAAGIRRRRRRCRRAPRRGSGRARTSRRGTPSAGPSLRAGRRRSRRVSGSAAASSASDSAPHSVMSPPTTQSASISVGLGHLLRDAGRRPEDARADRDADDERDRAPQPERARQLLADAAVALSAHERRKANTAQGRSCQRSGTVDEAAANGTKEKPMTSTVNVADVERWASALGGAALTAYGIKQLKDRRRPARACRRRQRAHVSRRHRALPDVCGGRYQYSRRPRRTRARRWAAARRQRGRGRHDQRARPTSCSRSGATSSSCRRFMDHLVSVQQLDERRSHWVAKAPGRPHGRVGRGDHQRDSRTS